MQIKHFIYLVHGFCMGQYTFLLGSGISLQSGVQSVGEITDALFGHNYWEHTDQSIIRGEHPSKYLREHYDVSEIQDFLKLIIEKTDTYLKERLGDNENANYEDLFDMVQQLNQEASNTRDNAATKPFYDKIEEESVEIREGYHGWNEPIDMNNITYKAMGFIESVIKYGLNEDELNGLNVLSNLFRADHHADIFTLNHDLLVEKLCKENKVNYADGFSELDGEIRWYQPSIWDEEYQVKIYKLHGSRNWYLVRHPEFGQVYAILTGRDKWHNTDAKGTRVQMQLNRGYILTGQRKAENYYSGIHGEIHFRFTQHLRSCRSLIVSGYGWNDIQINWKLFDWLDSNEKARMIIIHKNPKQMANDSRHLSWRTFKRYSDSGKILFIKKWFQDVELKNLEEYTSN